MNATASNKQLRFDRGVSYSNFLFTFLLNDFHSHPPLVATKSASALELVPQGSLRISSSKKYVNDNVRYALE
jgi:hypothetical protein